MSDSAPVVFNARFGMWNELIRMLLEESLDFLHANMLLLGFGYLFIKEAVHV